MWREQLIPPLPRIANYPITFGAYGSGPRPVLSGANLVNGLPYMVNDSFTGNALRGWVKGRGAVVATNDRLVAVLDDIDNTAGDYLTRDVPETKGPEPKRVDNDTKKLKKISMGNTYYAPAGVNMRVYLDDVRYSNREIDGTESVAWVATGASGSDGGAIYRGYSFYDSSTLFENYNPLRKVVWNTDLATTAPAMQKGNWTLDSKNWIPYVPW